MSGTSGICVGCMMWWDGALESTGLCPCCIGERYLAAQAKPPCDCAYERITSQCTRCGKGTTPIPWTPEDAAAFFNQALARVRAPFVVTT
jgi:hypothetical protein